MAENKNKIGPVQNWGYPITIRIYRFRRLGRDNENISRQREAAATVVAIPEGEYMSIADEIRKLDDLRKQGLLTDAEFERQKQTLLSSGSATERPPDPRTGLAWPEVELKNKWWFQALLSLIITPIGLLLVMFLKSFQKGRSGEAKPVSVGFKAFFVVLMLMLWGWGIVALSGGLPATTNDAIVECNSDAARQALANAVEGNAVSNITTLRLLDVTDVEDISLNDEQTVRRCNATLVLNSGRERHGYTLSYTSNGDLLVEIDPYPFQRESHSGERVQDTSLGAPPAVPDTEASGDDPLRYFAQAGISPRQSHSATSMARLSDTFRHDPSLAQLSVIPLASTEIAPGMIAMLVETGTTPEGELGCHACDAPISVAWISTESGPPQLIRFARDFDTVGGWGHAPPAVPVSLPDGRVGFAMTVGFTAQGVTELGCRIYEVTATNVSLRTDLSRRPSSVEAYECA